MYHLAGVGAPREAEHHDYYQTAGTTATGEGSSPCGNVNLTHRERERENLSYPDMY